MKNATQKIILLLCFVAVLGAGCDRVPISPNNTTSTAEVTDSIDCADSLPCLLKRAAKCLPTTGKLSATSHPLTELGSEDKARSQIHLLEYSLVGLQPDQYDIPLCHIRLTQTDLLDKQKLLTHSECIAHTEPDSQSFFQAWKNGQFFNSMLAYCNPRVGHDPDLDIRTALDVTSTIGWGWECSFPKEVDCVMDAAPWTPDTHG